MKYRFLVIMLTLSSLWVPASFGQSAEDAGGRRVLQRVSPAYPSVARNLHITGAVRVEALVGSNGTVKSVAIKGGHPMLAQAAAEAVAKWKWAPASHETEEPVLIDFTSQ